MKILVIGGTRFIGAAAVTRLHQQGHEVAVLNRGQSPVDPPDGVRKILGNRDDFEPSRLDIEEFGPEVVLHNVVVNEDHAKKAVDFFGGIATRLVMTSSCDVYRAYGRVNRSEVGPPDPVPLTEESPLRESLYPYRDKVDDPSHLLYSYDKIPAETAVMGASSLEGTVLRLPMVLGPSDYQHRLFPFLKPMDDGRPGIVLSREYADWASTYGDVENVAEAMALACTHPSAAARIFNVGDWVLTIGELGHAVQTATGWGGKFVIQPAEALPEEFALDIDANQALACTDLRIREELGYARPVEFEETVKRAIAWERENLPDPAPPGMVPYEVEDRVLAALGRES